MNLSRVGVHVGTRELSRAYGQSDRSKGDRGFVNSLSMNGRSFRSLEIGCGVNVTFQRASTMAH